MGEKEAIVILGGGLINENNEWRTTSFKDKGDSFGADGARLRVIAGSYLCKENPEIIFIASAGKGQYSDVTGAPTIASVIKKELIELGVPEENIFEERESGNTWQQLQEVKKIIEKQNLQHIVIISNRYHLPRLKAMVRLDVLLKEKIENKNIEFKSAEEILIRYNPEEWQEEIENVYKGEAMKERIILEEKGVKDIKRGRYSFK